MSDLSFGAHANVFLQPGEILRVSTSGEATVVAAYGAPDGTTTITAGTQDFGPYGVPAKLRVTAVSGRADYDRVDDMPLNSVETEAVRSLVSGYGVLYSGPAPSYWVALRSSQAGNGQPADQSPALNDPTTINTVLFPSVRQNSTTYSLNAYASPTILNGRLYKVTAGGGTSTGASEPTWPTTVGGTVVDGGITWTCEIGPWGASAAGLRHFCAVERLSGSTGHITLPVLDWDMAAGDSVVIRWRQAWDYDADARTNLALYAIMGNRHSSTNRRGIMINAEGGNVDGIKLYVGDGTNTVNSGVFGDGQSGRPKMSRPPGDGSPRDMCIAIDGQLKRAYCWAGGVAITQAEMYGGADKTPHAMDLSTVTGSTLSPHGWQIGNTPGMTVSYDWGMTDFDILLFKASGLPSRMADIAAFFYSRGSDALLPASLTV